MDKLKDNALLIIIALGAAIASWAFFAHSGKQAFDILMGALLIALFVDNRHLRKELNKKRQH